MTILQITDLHLYAQAGFVKYGVCPDETLAAVLGQVRAKYADCDRVILTGDLASDESREAYDRLCAMLDTWRPRCRLIPGNHDDRRLLRSVFALGAGETEALTFAESLAGWRLIGLDTSLPGELFGRLDPEQLDWLARELSEHAEARTILFLHHPPIPVNSPCLDEIGLRDVGPFQRLIAAAPQVQAILCGHVHQEFVGRLGQATVYAAPAAFLQFKPGCTVLEIDPLPPGYRVLRLDGPRISTYVERVAIAAS